MTYAATFIYGTGRLGPMGGPGYYDNVVLHHPDGSKTALGTLTTDSIDARVAAAIREFKQNNQPLPEWRGFPC